MTKLEELKAAADVLRRAGYAAEEARDAVWSQHGEVITWAACGALWDAWHAAQFDYEAELEKVQEEKTND